MPGSAHPAKPDQCYAVRVNRTSIPRPASPPVGHGRDLSTAFQFEFRFGAGLRSDRLDFHLRWMHYSNGSIEQPNHGVDALVAGIAVGF